MAPERVIPGVGDGGVVSIPGCRSEVATRRRTRLAAVPLAVAVLAAALYSAGFSRHWRMSLDSALYVGMARAVATGEAYNSTAPTRFNVPPVVPLCLAAAYRLGLAVEPGMPFSGAFVYMNAFEALCGLAGLVAVFFLVRELAKPIRAAAVLALVAVSCSYYSLSTQPMTDVPYCVVSWAAVLFLLRAARRPEWWNVIAAGAFLLLAPFTRLVGATLVLAALVFYASSARGAQRGGPAGMRLLVATALAAAATVALLVFMFPAAAPGSFSYAQDLKLLARPDLPLHVLTNIARMPGKLSAAVWGRGDLAIAGVPLAALVGVGWAIRWRRGEARLVYLYLVAYLASIALFAPAVPVRYMVPILPFVYLLALDGLAPLVEWAHDMVGRLRGKLPDDHVAATQLIISRFPGGVFAEVMLVNLFFMALWLAPGLAADFQRTYESGYYGDYVRLARTLEDGSPPGPIVARQSRLLHALTGIDAFAPPYRQFSGRRPTATETAAFVDRYGIVGVVVDPRNTDSARVLMALVDYGPFRWHKAASYGAVTLYLRDSVRDLHAPSRPEMRRASPQARPLLTGNHSPRSF